jgi:hypothetical protein
MRSGDSESARRRSPGREPRGPASSAHGRPGGQARTACSSDPVCEFAQASRLAPPGIPCATGTAWPPHRRCTSRGRPRRVCCIRWSGITSRPSCRASGACSSGGGWERATRVRACGSAPKIESVSNGSAGYAELRITGIERSRGDLRHARGRSYGDWKPRRGRGSSRRRYGLRVEWPVGRALPHHREWREGRSRVLRQTGAGRAVSRPAQRTGRAWVWRRITTSSQCEAPRGGRGAATRGARVR